MTNEGVVRESPEQGLDCPASRNQPGPETPAQLPGPKQFLLNTPRGAYTTLRVQRAGGGGAQAVGGAAAVWELVDWATHLDRLVRSLKAMHAALDGCYARYYAWLEGEGAAEPQLLQRVVSPAVRAALAAAEQAHDAAQHLMLVVALPPAPHQACGVDVRALAHPCGPPGSSPCSAVVLGGPRSVPEGKDSGWVADRQPLEALRAAAGAAPDAEVLLCTGDGRLLEGLITNLFVVTCDGPQGACSGEGNTPTAAETSLASQQGPRAGRPAGAARPVVWTAGVADGVVWGTARARVLDACRALGYEVREEAPSMHDRHTWREAFLTNSLRLLQPLHSIACSSANVWGHPAWEAPLPAAPGPVTAAIAAVVSAKLPGTPASEL